MAWKKLGCLFDPSGLRPWMATHAALPAPLPLANGQVRIFCSGRDDIGRARIGYFDCTLGAKSRAGNPSEEPAVDLGELGAFDDNGVTSSCVVTHEGRVYQYYTGWSLGVTVPFYLAIGLAVSDDGGNTFSRISRAPVLGRTDADPLLTASPCVRIENGLWRMWYVAGAKWMLEQGNPKHFYHVRYAESNDGVHWRPTGRVCIDFASEDEYAIARPCVMWDGSQYRMWYCRRGKAYRIGYAESVNGVDWVRKDAEAGIGVSRKGWDADMTAYPWVIDNPGCRYMLYNGNGYGKTGIGVARWEGAA